MIRPQQEQRPALFAPHGYIAGAGDKQAYWSSGLYAGGDDALHCGDDFGVVGAFAAELYRQVDPPDEQRVYAFYGCYGVDFVERLGVFDLGDDHRSGGAGGFVIGH